MPASSLFLPLLPLAASVPVFAGQDGPQQAAQTDIVAIRKDQWSRMTVPVKVVEQGPSSHVIRRSSHPGPGPANLQVSDRPTAAGPDGGPVRCPTVSP